MGYFYESSEYILGDVPIVRADRKACPVCGHPTGDCATDTSEPKHIIGIGIFNSIDKKLTFTVKEDIFEERQISPFTTARVLVVQKGQVIPVDKARELNLL